MSVLKMKVLVGYTVPEISERLGCSRSRVYQLLDCAKKAAREYLAE